MYYLNAMATIDLSSLSTPNMTVINGLQRLLSMTISATSSAQTAHWGIVGPDFFQLHAAFGAQYDELFDSQDLIAERVRQLDGQVVAECAGTPTLKPPFTAQEAVSKLLADRDAAIVAFKEVAKLARETGDTVTENFLLGLIEGHQKARWMLKSYLK